MAANSEVVKLGAWYLNAYASVAPMSNGLETVHPTVTFGPYVSSIAAKAAFMRGLSSKVLPKKDRCGNDIYWANRVFYQLEDNKLGENTNV